MKNPVRKLLIAVFALAFVAAGLYLLRQQAQDSRARSQYEDAVLLANAPVPMTELPLPPEEETPSVEPVEEPESVEEPEPVVEPEPVTEPEPAVEPIDPAVSEALKDLDLTALKQVNDQVVGWIYIPGTPISYPLMQGTDNQHYLKYTWQNTASRLGAIYLDYRNDPGLGDFHSIIYGHRIDSTTMFSSLRHYEKQSYFEEHPSVYIVTEDGILCYDIYAAAEVDSAGGHTYRLGLTDAAGQEAYINYSQKDSVLVTDVRPEVGDQILTLSTCTSLGSRSTKRWVVHAVLRHTWKEAR